MHNWWDHEEGRVWIVARRISDKAWPVKPMLDGPGVHKITEIRGRVEFSANFLMSSGVR